MRAISPRAYHKLIDINHHVARNVVINDVGTRAHESRLFSSHIVDYQRI
ncbi:hypothetical protein [Corynebacterium silvaticum]|nr:hypothetical protein [Corynebacterium silvaticum]MBH5299833.1 hypothetical protein [Corynebacterium silvaticum]